MNSKWLVIIDAKSKFPVVVDMNNNTSAKYVCDALEQVIDWFGPPETIVSDNGPPFNSYEMNKFYDKYAIKHITSPAYHPASNGLAERFVRSLKEGLSKQQKSGQTNKFIALRNVLRSYRWTPHTTTGVAPANMMLNYCIRTELDIMKPRKSTKQQPHSSKYYVGQLVWVLKPQLNHRPQWLEGIITKVIGSMVYEIQLKDGQCYKRHQNQIRPRYISNDESCELESLPDDLLNTQKKSNNVNNSNPSPRYPRRHRKPPIRFSP